MKSTPAKSIPTRPIVLKSIKNLRQCVQQEAPSIANVDRFVDYFD